MARSTVKTILQVTPQLEMGGVEVETVELACAYRAHGWQSIVVTQGGCYVERLEKSGVEVILMSVNTKNPFKIVWNTFKIAALIRQKNVDIIHARSRAPAWSCLWAAKMTHKPFVTTFHGTYNLKGLFKRFYNSAMVRADRVIAISSFIQSHVKEFYRPFLKPGALRLILRGVDTQVFNPEIVTPQDLAQARQWGPYQEGLPLLVLPGRLTFWKGQGVAIQAWGRLKRQGVSFQAWLVGSAQGRDGYVSQLKALIAEEGLEGIVHFVESAPSMPALYALADIVLHASIEPEAFGRTLIEAQAMERVIIAAALGAPTEIILSGRTGFLTPAGDVDALVETLIHALEMPEEARKVMGKEARQKVLELYDKKDMVHKNLSLYQELIA